MKNLVLVGFMGTGKTSVGGLLSKYLVREFVDVDKLIEEEQGMAILQIFAEKGEEYFRGAEKRVIKELSLRDNLVIAAGGGAVLFEENVANLKKNGIIFCLSAAPSVILQRTKGYRHRPLLNDVDEPLKRIGELMDLRASYYERAADYMIDTSMVDIEEVMAKIVDIVKGLT